MEGTQRRARQTRGHRALPSSADAEEEAAEGKNEDPWEDKYEESGFEQSELEDAKGRKAIAYQTSEGPTVEQRNRSWKRREAAKERLECTAARRLSLVPSPGGTFDSNANTERQIPLATIEEKAGYKKPVKKHDETRGGGLAANLSKPVVELWILPCLKPSSFLLWRVLDDAKRPSGDPGRC